MFSRKARILICGFALTASLELVTPQSRSARAPAFLNISPPAITCVIRPTVSDFVGYQCADHVRIFAEPASEVFPATQPYRAGQVKQQFAVAHATVHIWDAATEIALQPVSTGFEYAGVRSFTIPNIASSVVSGRTRKRS